MSFLDQLLSGLGRARDVASDIGGGVKDAIVNFPENNARANERFDNAVASAAQYYDPLYLIDQLNSGDGFEANFSRGLDRLIDPIAEGASRRYPNLFGSTSSEQAPVGPGPMNGQQGQMDPAQVIEQKKQEVAAESKQRTMGMEALMRMLSGEGGVVDGNTVLDSSIGNGRGPGGGSFSRSKAPIANIAPVDREDVLLARSENILDALRRRAIGGSREDSALYGKGLDASGEISRSAMAAGTSRDNANIQARADEMRARATASKESTDDLDAVWGTVTDTFRKQQKYYRENPDALGAQNKRIVDGKEVTLTGKELSAELPKVIQRKALEDALRAIPPRYQELLTPILTQRLLGE